jgi:hypothetical protein
VIINLKGGNGRLDLIHPKKKKKKNGRLDLSRADVAVLKLI